MLRFIYIYIYISFINNVKLLIPTQASAVGTDRHQCIVCFTQSHSKVEWGNSPNFKKAWTLKRRLLYRVSSSVSFVNFFDRQCIVCTFLDVNEDER